MTCKIKIPLEDNPLLLLEYGRAHAWINQVDYLLGVLIDCSKKRQKVFKKSCQGQTLGQKIQENKFLIHPSLEGDLNKFNEKYRRILAHHGFIMIMDMDSDDRTIRPSTIKDTGKDISLDVIDEDLLKETTKLSRKLAKRLIDELKK